MGKLKRRKAKDSSEWKNEYILEGGEEMKKSIRKIMDHVNSTHETPSD